MVARPRLFWGNSDNHFQSLTAYLMGYSVARSPVPDAQYHEEMERIIPPDFSRFVADHFGEKGYAAGHDWTRFIEGHTNSDREALELLLRLRRLYDQQTAPPAR